MDWAETLAKQYLDSVGLGQAIYEPDGGVPPDFVLGGRIAIEVRRLNQNYEHSGGFTGLESDAAALYRYMEKILPKFGPSQDGAGWWVMYDFRRPFDAMEVKRELPKVLKRLSQLPVTQTVAAEVTRNFTVELRPASIHRPELLSLGGYSDFDAGGFVAGEVIRNLNLCVAEKERKVAAYKHKYSEWWLILPDMIGASLNQEERESIPPHVQRGTWDRIILIDPRDPLRAFDVEPRRQ